MSYTMYTPLNVWLDPASVTDVVAYIQTYLSENTIYSQTEIETIIHDYLIAHPELIGGVQSVNGKTGTVVLSASDINTENDVTIESALASLSSQISSIAASVATNTNNITALTGRVSTAETDISNLNSNFNTLDAQLDGEITTRTNADTALSNRINALQGAVGSPLKADTVASMTDTSKIYVYTGSETGYTNGNWYYYNGTSWVSGGVYNAVAINTDKTLTVSDMAADAKVTGDKLDVLTGKVSYLGNWLSFTKPSGTSAIAFDFKSGHTYIVKNLSESGTSTFILRETPTGTDLQTIYSINAGTTREFKANQDANYICGWQASAQTFFIIDKYSKTEYWDGYQEKIDDIVELKTPYVLSAGGYDNADGTISENQYYSYTNFIDCSVLNKLRVVSNDGALNYCAWYKEDKTNGLRFTIPQGDTSFDMPTGYKYARLSGPTSAIQNISVYTSIWFNGAITREYIDKIKNSLPNRVTATKSTDGIVNLYNYNLIKGHTYLIENPNNFQISFSPHNGVDGTASPLGSTTINANSIGVRVSDLDGYCDIYFSSANGTAYIYDLDGEIQNKTITDLNIEATTAVQSARYKSSANPHILTLLHFSDIHADVTALWRLINYKDSVSNEIDDAICTGDIVSSKFGDSLEFWTVTDGAEKILVCVGNHDSYYTNSMDAAQLVPMATVAEKFINPFVSNWGTITRPANSTYYYKDYASGYRLIVLDAIRSGDDATAEATWLTNALSDARTNDLAVIIALHYMPTGAMYIYDCGFSKYGADGESGNICNAPNFAVQDIVQTFIDAGGKFMCYLIGHLHRDIFGYISGFEKQPCVMVTTASPNKASQEVNADLGRVVGHKSADAFNLITFDRDNNTVKLVRVGADIDNMMRPRKAISYNVSSKVFPQK